MKRKRANAKQARAATATRVTSENVLAETTTPEAMYATLLERWNMDEDWKAGTVVFPYPCSKDIGCLLPPKPGAKVNDAGVTFGANVLWRYTRHLAARAHHTAGASEDIRVKADILFDAKGAPRSFPETPADGEKAEKCLVALAELARFAREAGNGDKDAIKMLRENSTAARDVCVAFIEATGLTTRE
jgi:hypothetical protein